MEDQFYGTDSLIYMNTNVYSETGILHDIPTPRLKLKTNSYGKYRRLWILVMEFLTPYELMTIRKVNKLIYLVTFEQEVWRTVIRTYILHRPYKFTNLFFSVRQNRLILNKSRYSFWAPSNEAITALFAIKEHEFIRCEDLSFISFIQIQENYRDICYAIMTFNCMGCREYQGMPEIFYYKSLEGYLCESCIGLQKFRLLTECEACLENGISVRQFAKLNLDDEQGRYFDIMVKARLYMLKKNLPIPSRRQDIQFKQIKGRGRYPKDVRNPKLQSFKQHKKGR